MKDDAMFRSVDHALRFAYETEYRPIVERARSMLPSKAGEWRGMSSHDLHAQAALIRGRVERFPILERAYLHAYFGFEQARADGLERVTSWAIAQQPTGVYHIRAYRLMVQQYCGRGGLGGIEAIRQILKCRKKDAIDKRRQVWLSLDVLHKRSVWVAEQSFVSLGVVPEPVAA